MWCYMVAMQLICGCFVVATLGSIGIHVLAMWLLCGCYVVSILLLLLPLWLLSGCHLVAMWLLCVCFVVDIWLIYAVAHLFLIQPWPRS